MADPAMPTVEPFGDGAVLVRLGGSAGPALASRAQAVAAAIEAARAALPALGRPVPAHASVLVPIDPLELPFGEAAPRLLDLAVRAPDLPTDTDDAPVEIPVRYGGPDGPDLDDVAERLGLAADAVVDAHASATYRVLFLGFAPGFAYLGGLPPTLRLARRATARERVPSGSVAIAGEHSAVYPLSMPGGWNLIGRTDAALFDPRAPEPTPFRPGRRVRFVPR